MHHPDQLFELTNALQPLRRAWIQAAAAATTADSGFPFPVVTALILLARMGSGVQQSALAEAAGVNPAAMLRTLDLAEASGLCERREVPGNRRIKALHLLPPGGALARRAEKQLTQLRMELLDGVPPEEVEAAVKLLRTFGQRIQAYLSEA